MSFTPSRFILLVVGLAFALLAGAGFLVDSWGSLALGGAMIAWHGIGAALALVFAFAPRDRTARHASTWLGLGAWAAGLIVSGVPTASGYSALDPWPFGLAGAFLVLGGFLHGTDEDKPLPGPPA